MYLTILLFNGKRVEVGAKNTPTSTLFHLYFRVKSSRVKSDLTDCSKSGSPTRGSKPLQTVMPD